LYFSNIFLTHLTYILKLDSETAAKMLVYAKIPATANLSLSETSR